jgi:hypothetical protein
MGLGASTAEALLPLGLGLGGVGKGAPFASMKQPADTPSSSQREAEDEEMEERRGEEA